MKVNLIPEVKESEQKVKRLSIVGTTVCVLIVAAFIGLALVLSVINLAIRANKVNLEKRIADTNKRLEPYKELEKTVFSLENSLRGIKDLLDGFPKWSMFYRELEQATPNDVQITSLNLSGDKITLALKGKSVSSVGRFINSFKNYKYKKDDDFKGENLFINVEVPGYTESAGEISFTASMNLRKELLWQN